MPKNSLIYWLLPQNQIPTTALNVVLLPSCTSIFRKCSKPYHITKWALPRINKIVYCSILVCLLNLHFGIHLHFTYMFFSVQNNPKPQNRKLRLTKKKRLKLVMFPLPQVFLKTNKPPHHPAAVESALISKVINICQKEKDIMLVGDNPKMILTGRSESTPTFEIYYLRTY